MTRMMLMCCHPSLLSKITQKSGTISNYYSDEYNDRIVEYQGRLIYGKNTKFKSEIHVDQDLYINGEIRKGILFSHHIPS